MCAFLNDCLALQVLLALAPALVIVLGTCLLTAA